MPLSTIYISFYIYSTKLVYAQCARRLCPYCCGNTSSGCWGQVAPLMDSFSEPCIRRAVVSCGPTSTGPGGTSGCARRQTAPGHERSFYRVLKRAFERLLRPGSCRRLSARSRGHSGSVVASGASTPVLGGGANVRVRLRIHRSMHQLDGIVQPVCDPPTDCLHATVTCLTPSRGYAAFSDVIC